MARQDDLDRFYGLLDDLERRVGGARKLKSCDGYMDWPERGVYFFLEPGETRESSDQRRVTRVGTHAVSETADRSLWARLKEHHGTGIGSEDYPHGGSHRASVYRKVVGAASIEKHDLHGDFPDWDRPWRKIDRERSVVKDEEYILQRRVSSYIREQPFLWVEVDDEPSADSDRKFVERNAIALLSNYDRQPIDPRDEGWLGRHSPKQMIRNSGLWNTKHVDEQHDAVFLDRFADAVSDTDPL